MTKDETDIMSDTRNQPIMLILPVKFFLNQPIRVAHTAVSLLE